MSRDAAVAPILVAEGLDLLAFASIEDAEDHLEGIDVADGRIEVFDGRGRVLHAIPVDPQTARIMSKAEGGTAAGLRERLLRFAELTGLGAATGTLTTATVSELIAMVYQHQHPRHV